MTVGDIEQRMTPADLIEWLAYFRILERETKQ